ncbi:MAG: translocation/assembly module TamB domain-containing protein [Gemmatimonadota bacterium]|nr:MAG: translocation/assembly module TamB domain-containing protein [Gemmatimonadota bacterium]
MGLLFVFAAIMLGLFMLTLSPGEKVLKGFLEKQLRQKLGLEARIGRCETNLLSRVQFQDVCVCDPNSDTSDTLLTLNQARIQYSLANLLRRRLSIQSIDLDGLSMSLSRDSTGSLHFPIVSESASSDTVSPKPGFSVQLDRFSLKHASLTYQDALLLLGMSVENVSSTIERREDEAYSFSLRVDSVDVGYQGIPLSGKDFELRGILNERRISLDSLSANVMRFELSGKGELVRDETPSSVRGDFLLKGNPERLLQAVHTYLPKGLTVGEGDLNLALHVDGSLDHPKALAHLDLPHFEIYSVPIQKGHIEADVEPGFITIGQAKMQLLNGDVSAKCDLNLDSLSLNNLVVKAEQVHVAKVWQIFYGESSPYQGIINMDVAASGIGYSLKDWDVSADLLMTQVRYRSQRLPDFVTKIKLRNGTAEFLSKHNDFVIKAEADVTQRRLTGRFSVDIFKLETLAELFNFQELSGALQIQGTAGGELSAPEISANLRGKHIQYQNFPIDTLLGEIQYAHNQIHISNILFSGTADTIDSLNAPFHIQHVRGGMEYKGRASGPVNDLHGTLAVMLRELRYDDIDFDKGIIEVELKEQKVTLSTLELQKDSLLIQAGGEFTIPSSKGGFTIDLHKVPSGEGTQESSKQLFKQEGAEGTEQSLGMLSGMFDMSDRDAISFQIDGDQLDLKSLEFVLNGIPEIGGLCRFHFDFVGNGNDPKAELIFNITKPRYQRITIDSLKGHIAFNENKLTLHLFELYHEDQYAWAGGLLRLDKKEDGTYGLSKSCIINGQAKGQGIDLRPLNLFFPEDMELFGQGFFDLRWDGAVTDPHVTGFFEVQKGTMILGSGKPTIDNIHLALTLEDSVFMIEEVYGVVQETPFSFTGQVEASKLQQFSLTAALSVSDYGVINGDGYISPDSLRFNTSVRKVDLSLLGSFFPEVKQLSGRLGIEVAVDGSIRSPSFNGKLEIRDFSLMPHWLTEPLSGGVLKVRFRQNEVHVDSVFAHIGSGAVLITGSAAHTHRKLTDMKLQATMHNVHMSRPREFDIIIKSAQLSYTKQNNLYYIDGDVTLGETRLTHRFQPRAILSFMRKVERPAPTPPLILQQTRLNIRLRESDRIWIDNNLAHLRLRSELNCIGTLANPNISGRLSFEEGYALYLDRKFQIKRGIMDFVNPHRVNPIVDLAAEANIKSYQTLVGTPYVITISISGPLDEAVVNISSDPPLDKPDIVALLTVGATRGQMTGRDSEGEGTSVGEILKERLAVLSSQRVSNYASRKVGTLLGLDQMTIEGNLFPSGRSWGPQLLASKKLSDRMGITYTTTVGHMNEQSIRLDYRLSRYFSVEGQTDQRGRSGMDLKYRLKFK